MLFLSDDNLLMHKNALNMHVEKPCGATLDKHIRNKNYDLLQSFPVRSVELSCKKIQVFARIIAYYLAQHNIRSEHKISSFMYAIW